MDLNQLLFDHQISLMRASATCDRRLLAAHADNAATIARRIEDYLKERHAPAAARWELRYRSDDQPGRSGHPHSTRSVH